jgi:hypothetical protein
LRGDGTCIHTSSHSLRLKREMDKQMTRTHSDVTDITAASSIYVFQFSGILLVVVCSL